MKKEEEIMGGGSGSGVGFSTETLVKEALSVIKDQYLIRRISGGRDYTPKHVQEKLSAIFSSDCEKDWEAKKKKETYVLLPDDLDRIQQVLSTFPAKELLCFNCGKAETVTVRYALAFCANAVNYMLRCDECEKYLNLSEEETKIYLECLTG